MYVVGPTPTPPTPTLQANAVCWREWSKVCALFSFSTQHSAARQTVLNEIERKKRPQET